LPIVAQGDSLSMNMALGRIGGAIESNAAESPAPSGVSVSPSRRSSNPEGSSAAEGSSAIEASVDSGRASAGQSARGVRGVRVRRRKKRRELRRRDWIHAAKVTAYYVFCLVVSAGVAYVCVHAREARAVLHSQ
jgi:hypothetical protein